MPLTPRRPPGRANRKALVYTAEIHQLRAAGYSFEAIRVALLDAGLQVSLTTLKREAAKGLVDAPAMPQRPAPLPSSFPAPSEPAVGSALRTPAKSPSVPGSFVGEARSGKEIVDAFMQGRITNPLMQGGTPP